MATDGSLRDDNRLSMPDVGHAVRRVVAFPAKLLGYSVAFVIYSSILIVAIATLGLIEIRQANLQNSNALIAMLEQRDRYSDGYFTTALSALITDTSQYDEGLRRLVSLCPAQSSEASNSHNSTDAEAVPARSDSAPQTCHQLKSLADQHFFVLLALQDDLRIKQAYLPKYYNEYFDGLREKTPQLMPLLRFMDSQDRVITGWARLPLELHEMVLLICMGALGAVISLTRCFVDASMPDPTARDLCYRPVVGAVIALGIYVLFRAAQLFFGTGGPENTTVSTSVFVVAALGLASGVSAREAVTQMQRMTLRLLSGAEAGRDGSDKPTMGPPAAAADRAEAVGRPAPAATG